MLDKPTFVKVPSDIQTSLSLSSVSSCTPMSRPNTWPYPAPNIPPPTHKIALPHSKIIEPDYLQLILNARVYDVAIESPLTLATKLSSRLQNKIYLKREDLQPIFSFKCRGAYNRMVRLNNIERERGVICVSAGNHAQGVALAAQKLGIKATIVMPTFAPLIKVDNVKRLGATVILKGDDFDAAKRICAEMTEEFGFVFIPPFDCPYVIAGQGTVGVEILRQIKQDHLDAIFVCCGGGGLLAGIAAYVKRIRPEVKVIGVNAEDSDAMYQSLQRGERIEKSQVGLFADGTAVRLVGEETFKLCKKFVDDFVLVGNDDICAAIKDTFEDTRSILEPAGALALAGAKKYLNANPQIQNGVFVAILSGANMNFDQLRFVAERARLGDNKEALLSVKIPEKPGTLMELYSVIFPRSATEISYRYQDIDQAHVYMAFDIQEGKSEINELIQLLGNKNMEALDISDNEMAKTHARYLAGGRSTTVNYEVVYRVTFAQRPGALMKFFNHLKSQPRNVSLFHYRNHGADIARVLLGFQIDELQRKECDDFMKSLDYYHVNETENPVYTHFLH